MKLHSEIKVDDVKTFVSAQMIHVSVDLVRVVVHY